MHVIENARLFGNKLGSSHGQSHGLPVYFYVVFFPSNATCQQWQKTCYQRQEESSLVEYFMVWNGITG